MVLDLQDRDLASREKRILEHIAQRFAPHEGDPVMAQLLEALRNYVVGRLRADIG